MSISGTNKGFLSTRRYNNVYRDYPDNLVLFVFMKNETVSEFNKTV